MIKNSLSQLIIKKNMTFISLKPGLTKRQLSWPGNTQHGIERHGLAAKAAERPEPLLPAMEREDQAGYDSQGGAQLGLQWNHEEFVHRP